MAVRILAPMVLFAVVSTVPGCASPPSGDPGPRDAADPVALLGHVDVLAHDSMKGRATPSDELEDAARHVASRFDALGLSPGGDEGGYFARFPLAHRTVDPSRSYLVVGGDTLALGPDFRRYGGAPPFRPGVIEAPVLLAQGPISGELPAVVDGAIVIVDRAPGTSQVAFRSVVGFASSGARAVFGGMDSSDAEWSEGSGPSSLASRVDPLYTPSGATTRRPSVSFYHVRDRALERIYSARGVGVSLPPVSDPDSLVLHDLGRGQLVMEMRTDSTVWSPNVIGVLPGADPDLSKEYVVLAAHLDGLGTAPGSGEILNGADDNASGVAVLLEVARMLAQGPRPLRTVLFAAVSGEEIGLVGSAHLAAHLTRPPLRAHAAISMDMVGRWWEDRVVMASELGSDLIYPALQGALMKAPELGVTLWDAARVDAEFPGAGLTARSDHASFAEQGIPSLHLFTSGLHDDYHQASDDVQGVDVETMTTVATMAALLVRALASPEGSSQR